MRFQVFMPPRVIYCIHFMFQYGVNLGDMQFLYIDLVITTTIAVLSK